MEKLSENILPSHSRKKKKIALELHEGKWFNFGWTVPLNYMLEQNRILINIDHIFSLYLINPLVFAVTILGTTIINNNKKEKKKK